MAVKNRSQRTLVPLAVVGALTITAGAGPRSAGAQCRVDGGPARPFGPRLAAADSGRIYSYLLAADGLELYFFKRIGSAGENYRILRSRFAGSAWGSPEPVALGGDYSDLYPALSRDGTRLVFSSYRPAPHDTSSTPNAHLWMARRQGNGWGPPEFIAASRLGHYHSGLRLDSQGTLRFRVTPPDWRTWRDVELAWADGAFAPASVEAPADPAADYWRSRSGDSLHVWGALQVPGGHSLVKVSVVSRPNGRRAPAQFYLTSPRAGAWTPLVKAGGGLGDGAPNFPWVSADGCFVHYTRDYSEFMRVPLATVFAPQE